MLLELAHFVPKPSYSNPESDLLCFLPFFLYLLSTPFTLKTYLNITLSKLILSLKERSSIYV